MKDKSYTPNGYYIKEDINMLLGFFVGVIVFLLLEENRKGGTP